MGALVVHFECFPDERFYYVLRTFFELKNEEKSDKKSTCTVNKNKENVEIEEQSDNIQVAQSDSSSTVNLFTSLIKSNSCQTPNLSSSQKFQIDCMLNRLLQTSPELKQIRETGNKSDLLKIYEEWIKSNCLSGAFCVCLWAENYDSAVEVLEKYDKDVVLTDDHVKELERIVDYFEGPCFIKFRIDLMENRNRGLLKCLYRLLAVLPQKSKQFLALKTRLAISVQFKMQMLE